MKGSFLKIHPEDNVIVALRPLSKGEILDAGNGVIELIEDIPVKHKVTMQDMKHGATVKMYGVPVGRATSPIPKGSRIRQENTEHFSSRYAVKESRSEWKQPNVDRFANRNFQGYYRKDGSVGTRNFWLVIPLVFCENRNLEVLKTSLVEKLGYATTRRYALNVDPLIKHFQTGANIDAILETDLLITDEEKSANRIFEHVDGIKFLTHEGGCGCTRQDSDMLCRLLAGYINNPNVAGATVLSLGCQNAQFTVLQEAVQAMDTGASKPIYLLEQQQSKSERAFIADAIKQTFAGMMIANQTERRPAPLSKLCIGLECGGSDGFSGITANPALGHTSDLIVALGGRTILAEFPELHGVEQELVDRCIDKDVAAKFDRLMTTYHERAKLDGSGFAWNPSPGNIRDGLITDAMKSAGAAKKGGTSPVVSVLDYAEQASRPGLHLLCTPGGDVESTTGLAGSGANVIVFTTGLGTATGNAVAPTIKMSTNTMLAQRMSDLIDIDAGTIISGSDDINSKGEELLDVIIEVASGERTPHAERIGQDDFIPWKRGISL
ncbi:MAG: altronate dehydratase family protein [Saprospiraceae bacterium]|nr:altronate dehydratase family protein [Saprospiraceae bacterium]